LKTDKGVLPDDYVMGWNDAIAKAVQTIKRERGDRLEVIARAETIHNLIITEIE
jgi:hypothetical protein